MNKNIILIASLMVIVVICLQLSRPDSGGAAKCEKETQIEGLSSYLSSSKMIFPWKPFEEPKFRFKIRNRIELMQQLRQIGYTNWKRGGIEFGSICVGSEPYEDHMYASHKLSNGRIVFISISEANNEIIIVVRD